MQDLRDDVHDGITFDWNGETIRFDDWADDDYGIFNYQTRDGCYEFSFDLQPVVAGIVRVYILDAPSYAGRPTDGHTTHRILEHQGAYAGFHYISIRGDAQPTNVPDALSWAVYWAEKSGDYLSTGRCFS